MMDVLFQTLTKSLKDILKDFILRTSLYSMVFSVPIYCIMEEGDSFSPEKFSPYFICVYVFFGFVYFIRFLFNKYKTNKSNKEEELTEAINNFSLYIDQYILSDVEVARVFYKFTNEDEIYISFQEYEKLYSIFCRGFLVNEGDLPRDNTIKVKVVPHPLIKQLIFNFVRLDPRIKNFLDNSSDRYLLK